MRNYAQIQLAIWNNDDFRALTANAQHLYFMLISHPSLMQCGVGDWRPARLARFVSDWTREDVERAAGELMDRLFILVDPETEEFLVRSYIRNDGFMKQPNMGVALARSLAEVGSETLRGVVVHELNRLHGDRPELKGFGPREVQEVLRKGPIDPSGNPLGNPFGNPSDHPSDHPSVDPSGKGSGNPSVDPSGKGSGNPSVDPSGNPSVDPSPTPVPTPNTFPRGETRKGLRGSGGEGETGNGSVVSVKAESSPQNLDELAAAHADRYRCDRHKGLPDGQVPPCRACQAIREAAEESATLAADEAKAARRAAIDACDLCDDTGHKLIDGIAYKCNHTQHAEKPAQIRDWRTKTA